VMPIFLLLVQQVVHNDGNQVGVHITLRVILIFTMVKKRENVPLSIIPVRQMNTRCLATIFLDEGEHIVRSTGVLTVL
jgi:hypothetical protein